MMFLNGIVVGLNIADRISARRPKPVSERFWSELTAMLRKSATMNRFAGNCITNKFEVEISDIGRFAFTVEPVEMSEVSA